MTAAPRLLRAGLAAGALLLVPACGPDTVRAGPGDGPTTTATSPVVVLDSLALDVSGGLVPIEVGFASVPRLTVTAQGQVITGAAVMAIYPGPMLAPLAVRTIDDAGRAALARLVVESGLATSPAPDLGVPGVADAPTTTLRLVLDGARIELVAPALDEARPDDDALTAAQQDLRARLRALVAALGDLDRVVGAEHLGPEALYEPEGVWLRADVATDAPQHPPVAGPAPTTAAWTVPGVDLATLGRPELVEGPTASAVLALLADADQLTRFVQDDVVYRLLARPALPGERP